MQTHLTLRSGNGPKKLLANTDIGFSAFVIRYDEGTGKRIKTTELIIGETEDAPVDPPIPPYERRFISVGLDEMELREKVKNAGGRWHPEAVAWALPYERIVFLGLTAARMISCTVPGGFGTRQEYARVYAFA